MFLQNKKIVIINYTTGIGLSAASALVDQSSKPVFVASSENNCTQVKALPGDRVSIYSGNSFEPETTSFANAALQHKTDDVKSRLLIWLEKDSFELLQPPAKLTFPLHFSKENRAVYLHGKAFFGAGIKSGSAFFCKS